MYVVQRPTLARTSTKETSNWKALMTPGHNAAIILMNLASDSKYREMQCAWRVPHNTISLVVHKVGKPIVHEYAYEMLRPIGAY